LVIIPIGILAILSQLGGITVMMGAGLFAANRVNLCKLLVMVGTGQGLFTIASGELWSVNNYVTWLTSTATTGLRILFAVVSPSIAKGKGDSLVS
jgi:hypothetical protein